MASRERLMLAISQASIGSFTTAILALLSEKPEKMQVVFWAIVVGVVLGVVAGVLFFVCSRDDKEKSARETKAAQDQMSVLKNMEAHLGIQAKAAKNAVDAKNEREFNKQERRPTHLPGLASESAEDEVIDTMDNLRS